MKELYPTLNASTLDAPVFSKQLLHVIKKRRQIISKIKSKHWTRTHKFDMFVRVSCHVSELSLCRVTTVSSNMIIQFQAWCYQGDEMVKYQSPIQSSNSFCKSPEPHSIDLFRALAHFSKTSFTSMFNLIQTNVTTLLSPRCLVALISLRLR